jgi:hypothetical protein
LNKYEITSAIRESGGGAGIEIKFSGPAVNGGRMRMSDFVQSAHGLQILVDTASKELRGDQSTIPPLEAQIDANFQRASFDFYVWLAHNATTVGIATLALIESDATSKALELLSKVFGAAGSLFELVKASKGKEPTAITQTISNNGAIQNNYFFAEGSNPVIVSPDVEKLFKNRELREGAQAFVSPLRHDGIEQIELKPDNQNIPSLVTKDDAKAFAVPKADLKHDDESLRRYDDQIVEVVKSPFIVDRRWRLLDRTGDFGEFGAEMLDSAFTSQVTNREMFFGAGDRLKVDFTVRTYPNNRREFFVTKVHGKISPDSPDQMSLF